MGGAILRGGSRILTFSDPAFPALGSRRTRHNLHQPQGVEYLASDTPPRRTPCRACRRRTRTRRRRTRPAEHRAPAVGARRLRARATVPADGTQALSVVAAEAAPTRSSGLVTVESSAADDESSGRAVPGERGEAGWRGARAPAPPPPAAAAGGGSSDGPAARPFVPPLGVVGAFTLAGLFFSGATFVSDAKRERRPPSLVSVRTKATRSFSPLG
mmetsp:Transcript_5471/g.12688  ORF Transcript_5471/g.12688 Transcript_5471/m.12688 type:complete len:215 (-) Transcript_5471:570-1214(-)